MNQRVETLATRLEQGAAKLAAYAESLNSQQWATLVAQEERSVGVLVHHVATMYPLETQLAQAIASGQAVTGVTWEAVADINAKHADDHADPDRTATLTLLRQNSAAAATADLPPVFHPARMRVDRSKTMLRLAKSAGVNCCNALCGRA
ncbi:hypothetical protein BH10CHL1_BH10CHL1_49310 [soil metagenome]